MATPAYVMALLIGACLGPTAGAELPRNQEAPLSTGRALVGVDRLGVGLTLYGPEQDVRLIDAATLKAQIVAKLSGAGIKHVEGDLALVPRLVVRIESTQVSDDDTLVCRVQTALIRHVLLSSPPNLPLAAEVWQSRPALAMVPQTRLAETITSAVAGQMERFIDSYTEVTRLSRLAPKLPPGGSAPAGAGYSFVSAKDSLIFHRPDCRWAQGVASDNRVGYKNRQEAVQAGKRPCKTCQP